MRTEKAGSQSSLDIPRWVRAGDPSMRAIVQAQSAPIRKRMIMAFQTTRKAASQMSSRVESPIRMESLIKVASLVKKRRASHATIAIATL